MNRQKQTVKPACLLCLTSFLFRTAGPLDVLGMSYAQDGEIARASVTSTFDE